MEIILGFLSTNWVSLVVVLVFAGVSIYLWQKGYKKNVSFYMLLLISKAESQFQHGENQTKLNSVITGLYEHFPSILKFFYTRDDLVKLIDEMVADTKDWLQNQSK